MTRRTKPLQLTPLELEIMQVLWDSGPAAVQLVQSRLDARLGARKLAYTTVQTMLNVLWRKGKVKRTLVDRAYHYRPAVTREKALGAALHDVVERLFGGSAEALVLSLVETKHLTAAKLDKLRKMVEEES